MERKKAYYWCTCLQMITPIKVRRLIEEAGGPSEVFGQSDEKLVQMGFTAREQRIYHEACAMEKTIEAEYEKLSQSGIRFVTIEDEEYPVLLKEVADRPIGLFVKGNLPKSDFPKIAIVGAACVQQLWEGVCRGNRKRAVSGRCTDRKRDGIWH